MKAVIRRLHQLEERLAPKPDLASRRAAEILGERRRPVNTHPCFLLLVKPGSVCIITAGGPLMNEPLERSPENIEALDAKWGRSARCDWVLIEYGLLRFSSLMTDRARKSNFSTESIPLPLSEASGSIGPNHAIFDPRQKKRSRQRPRKSMRAR